MPLPIYIHVRGFWTMQTIDGPKITQINPQLQLTTTSPAAVNYNWSQW